MPPSPAQNFIGGLLGKLKGQEKEKEPPPKPETLKIPGVTAAFPPYQVCAFESQMLTRLYLLYMH